VDAFDELEVVCVGSFRGEKFEEGVIALGDLRARGRDVGGE
jgi:hypothetical protein